MFNAHPDLTEPVVHGLGWLYVVLFLMNAVWTVRVYRQGTHSRMRLFGLLEDGQEVPNASFWALYSALLLMVAIAHFQVSGDYSAEHFVIRMPDVFKTTFDGILGNSKLGPVLFFGISILGLAVVILLRRWLVRPTVAWTMLNVALVLMALSMTDYDFRQIVGKPDNVPIVAMLFIVAYFTWLYFRRSVENDQRRAEGRPLLEEEDNEKVLVWPDLVYTELVCMIVLTVVLVAWGIALQAPLEEPASAVKTPNPSKAPWYFLGLQEMLVYYDPWLAGVVFPSLIIVGLMAIPYIDFNKRGSGYYTFNERPFAVSVFLFGFLPLWVAMIILGTFLRGPNWNIFGFYEYWDVHKLEVLSNVNLSEYFWVYSPWAAGLPDSIFLRELPGFVAIAAYLLILPPLLAATVFKTMFHRMGFIRYMVFVNLLLLMAALPIKMVLRWAFNLKYIVAIPEWFFNI
jgi:hypothetical protein